MKTKIYNWLLKKLNATANQKPFTVEQIKRINEFKTLFRIHFEGWDETDRPIDYFPIVRFDITDLLYKFEGDQLIVTVVLVRPGLLIGKAGRTIDGLNEYLEKFNCKVKIEESKLWNYLK